MIYVAFDPGLTTGMCILGDGNRATFAFSDEQILARAYHEYLAGLTPVTTIIEFVPIASMTPMNVRILKVIARLWTDFSDFEIVLPGTWKSSAQAKAFAPYKTPHERDAFHMCLYFQEKNK